MRPLDLTRQKEEFKTLENSVLPHTNGRMEDGATAAAVGAGAGQLLRRPRTAGLWMGCYAMFNHFAIPTC